MHPDATPEFIASTIFLVVDPPEWRAVLATAPDEKREAIRAALMLHWRRMEREWPAWCARWRVDIGRGVGTGPSATRDDG